MNNPNQTPEMLEDDEISLLELATTLGQEKKLIFGLPAVAGAVAIVVSLLLTPVFTAKTTLIPPQQGGGGAAAAALASLGGLAGLAGISAPGGSSETVVSMLNSRSARDMIIDQFDLMKRYDVKFREDAYKELEKRVLVASDKKSNVITIEVDDEDPKFAADMANAYYQVLKKLMTRVAVTEAQQRRLYFEGQFQKAKQDLSEAEVKLKEVSEKTGLVELKAQAEASIQAVARLKAEIAQREVQLGAMRTFATQQNSDYQRVQAELAGLKAELAKMEARDGGKNGNADVGLLNAGNLPSQGLAYVRALREVKYQEAIFEIMAKQYELAKADEAKDGGNVQQLDVATPPERKSKPKRALIVLGAVLGAGFLAVLLALLKGALRNAQSTDEARQRWQQFRQAWRFK
ncbi:Wzz/FepE/Etk N-terminal domain-containing protein [Limnobacter humi]|uniref:Wzz/FepE/Etk N-terminal domain-containing protein n=1 Tax=Limnobacter humi TaxID=1778671 RepID=A0ABT1WKL4_9BURK|nr:Wzz/FepE/Etk N-terminal domain-containing protein [Limnobacter humi]MCQ8897741.1 Wzz/FepE/Etk N-terminal domain-containing protein [Limnobacter humi]